MARLLLLQCKRPAKRATLQTLLSARWQGDHSLQRKRPSKGAAPSAPEASVAQPAEQPAASSSDAPPVQPEAAAAQTSPTRNPEVEALSLQVGELLTTVQTLTQALATLQQPAALHLPVLRHRRPQRQQRQRHQCQH